MEQTTQSMTTPERSEQSQSIATSALHRVSEAPAVMKDSIESLVDFVQRYPLPTVLLGLGIGYLLAPTAEFGGRMAFSRGRPLTDTVSNMGSRIKETAQHVGQSMTDTASDIGSRAQDWAATAAHKASDATTAIGEQFGPLTDLGSRYPFSSFLLGVGLGYWLASSRE